MVRAASTLTNHTLSYERAYLTAAGRIGSDCRARRTPQGQETRPCPQDPHYGQGGRFGYDHRLRYNSLSGPDSVEVAGFEKTLRATKESMIVTNNTSHEITAIGLDITYLDMKGRMLHRTTRSIQLPEGLPPARAAW